MSEQFAQLAGLIEADGSVGICVNNKNTHIVRVRFFNTDTRLINWVSEAFGGKIHIANSNSSYGRRTCYAVEWVGVKALPILEGIQPYMRGVKSEVVELAAEHILQRGTLDTQEILAEAIACLNKRRKTK